MYMFMYVNASCCSCRPIRQLLGGDTGISNENVMVYMGMIEHRATQLCNLLLYGQLRVSEKQTNRAASVVFVVNGKLSLLHCLHSTRSDTASTVRKIAPPNCRFHTTTSATSKHPPSCELS